MHKIFGTKNNAVYTDREGVYLIPFHNNKIGVIKTNKGYFFLGGGLAENESRENCIIRECIEETGYTVKIKEFICSAETYCTHPQFGFFHPIQYYYIGELQEKVSEPIEADHELIWFTFEELKGKMFTEMQNWALELIVKELKRF